MSMCLSIDDTFDAFEPISNEDALFIQGLKRAASEAVSEQLFGESGQFEMMPHEGLLPPPLPHDMRDQLIMIPGIRTEARAFMLSILGIKSAYDFAQLNQPENQAKFEQLARVYDIPHATLSLYVDICKLSFDTGCEELCGGAPRVRA